MARAEAFPDIAMEDILTDIADWLTASELPATDARIASTPLAVWDIRPGTSLREADFKLFLIQIGPINDISCFFLSSSPIP